MLHTRLLIPLLALLTLLATAACAPAAQPTPTTAPAKPTEAPKPTAAPAASPSPSPAAKPAPSPAASPAAAASPSPAAAAEVTASLRPLSPMPQPGSMPANTYLRTIQERGRLIAGVRQDVLLFGYLNPRTNQLEGFDIDIVREVTRAIFGDASKVEFRTVTSASRIPSLQEGTVDIVASTMTINADRKQQIDFSTVYYDAGQRVLVKKDAPYNSIQDLSGKKVCAAKGSTSEQNIPKANPQAEVVQADQYTDCLLLLQQGRADAVSTDDVILASLAAQDPNTKLVGPKFSSEPYGLGIAKGRPEFVRFVNGVLEQVKTSGRWTAIYNQWLGQFAPAPEPPKATYVD